MSEGIPVIGAALKNNESEDFYNVMAWLRDSSNPNIRQLHGTMVKHMDGRLKAAVLLRLPDNAYQLVLLHDHMLKRFQVCISRRTPTWTVFMKDVRGR